MAEKTKRWTRDPLKGAELITELAHGLLTGPCAVAFMRQSALGQGADLMAASLMDTAEALASEALARSFRRCEEASGIPYGPYGPGWTPYEKEP